MEIPEELIKIKNQLKPQKHPKSICIANYKGGVGKTTISCLIGYYLAKKGNKVLLFDIDPQCSLSLAVGLKPEKVNRRDDTIYNLVMPNKWDHINSVNFQNFVDNVPDRHAPSSLKIVKGSFDVDLLDIAIIEAITKNNKKADELFYYCRNMLNAFKNFDYIIVDCPPNKMYLTQAMLRACSYYLTVTIPDVISVYGMPRLLDWVKEIPKDEKPMLLGCILNAVNRSGGNQYGTNNQQSATNKLLKDIKNFFTAEERKIIGSKPLLTYIPRLDVISKFLSQGDEKIARFDFNKRNSDQESVNEVMMNLISRLEKRIDKYA